MPVLDLRLLPPSERHRRVDEQVDELVVALVNLALGPHSVDRQRRNHVPVPDPQP